MIKKALEKLSENQIRYCKMMSYIINSARDKNAKFEYERYTGKLRGYLECARDANHISEVEMRSLYLWFVEEDRYDNSKMECVQYELLKTFRGYEIRKKDGNFYLYISKVYNGKYEWVRDHTYAKHFSLKTAQKHIEILENRMLQVIK